MVVFKGALNRVNFAITRGKVVDVTEDAVSVADATTCTMLDFSLSAADFNIGSPVERDLLSEQLRSRNVEVLEVFPWTAEDRGTAEALTLFPLLPAIDVTTLRQ